MQQEDDKGESENKAKGKDTISWKRRDSCACEWDDAGVG